ncbi:hypothetical protein M3599_23540 [Niallia circulans]|uniref:hypothetical protein n=1 Tax=Niallia circulans TaxID=1397 RepID=UPI00204144A2|nr:hypothetical protein [Niallia circulans]MCM2983871.1 hypothetical protein [Niallia circulans]
MIEILSNYQWLVGLLVGFFLNMLRDRLMGAKEDRKLIRSIESIKNDIQTERFFLNAQIPNLNEYKLSELKFFYDTIDEPVKKCLESVVEMNKKIMEINNNMIREKYDREYRLFSGHFLFWHNILKFKEYYEIYYEDSLAHRNETNDKQKFDLLMSMIKESSSGLTDYLKI